MVWVDELRSLFDHFDAQFLINGRRIGFPVNVVLDLVQTLHDLPEINLGSRNSDTETFSGLDIVRDGCRLEQGFAWNAAGPGAVAAEPALFDERGLCSQRG